ncbi:hypothetical protein MesoLjLc_63950 [Mesorhizobium sp. L-8-10]|uniref:TetR/AcrR family transcriptional regulator n=1 Tax=Mesorhizobium sp. L-8-10 TaxID=2744523 RepID=UPI0019379629|nr:TetR/AcrR family transcriptional regulator [Mesorhizobium sp. L-8-10]BCH34465.1 hypothetical protein MesoLjLc_63950 [Mesorhizobium sp. L-8-10]
MDGTNGEPRGEGRRRTLTQALTGIFRRLDQETRARALDALAAAVVETGGDRSGTGNVARHEFGWAATKPDSAAIVSLSGAGRERDEMAQSDTRTRIIGAAELLFYEHGLRSVGVDAIAERAGVTKRTLYYHFRSKDDLIAAYLAARDAPTVERYRRWLGDGGRPMPERIMGLFHALADYAERPKWRGCGFTRAAVELADQPGHPAVAMAADHKRRFEAWLAHELDGAGVSDAVPLARQLMILVEGAIMHMLIHRDTAYAISAGDAAATIVARGLVARVDPGRPEGDGNGLAGAAAMYTD